MKKNMKWLFVFLSLLGSFNSFATPVEDYWNKHTVNNKGFQTAQESFWYLSWRNEQYPFFRDLMFPDLKNGHTNQVILDYGSGTGDDITNFLIHSAAQKIIGVDVSLKAIDLTKKRLQLHKEQGYDTNKVEIIHINDADAKIPLPDQSVDFIHCCGVLMHVSHPDLVLKEFNRILKPGGKGRIMVYNRDSIWAHLYVAYQKIVLGQPMDECIYTDKYNENSPNRSLSFEEAFKRSTDGENCPISRPYRASEFIDLVKKAGLNGRFINSYYSVLELDIYNKLKEYLHTNLPYGNRLNPESQTFIKELRTGPDGYPKYNTFNAGIGGIYEIEKPA